MNRRQRFRRVAGLIVLGLADVAESSSRLLDAVGRSLLPRREA